MNIRIAILAAAITPLLGGCIVGRAVDTAVDVATLPVKAGAKAVDLATTSEEEKDKKFLRKLRRACEKWEDARKDDPGLPPPNDSCD